MRHQWCADAHALNQPMDYHCQLTRMFRVSGSCYVHDNNYAYDVVYWDPDGVDSCSEIFDFTLVYTHRAMSVGK